MEEKKKNIISKLREKKKIILLILATAILGLLSLFIVFTNINSIDLEKYSLEAQEILYAIEYYDTSSLDTKKLKELDSEILEKSAQNKNEEIEKILLNYHMGIGMISDNANTDNEMIINNIKNYLESAESKYKSLLSKKHKEYKKATKKEEYKKIDNYKLSDLLDLKVDYNPEMNVRAIYSLGTSLYTGYSNCSVVATNKKEKEIKYIDVEVNICNEFKDKLTTKAYKCIGPFTYNKYATINFDKEYISDYKIAKYIKLERVKITYMDNSIIELKNDKIDQEAKEINIYY